MTRFPVSLNRLDTASNYCLGGVPLSVRGGHLWYLVLPATMYVVAFVIYPLLFSVYVSFLYFPHGGLANGQFVGIGNYANLLNSSAFHESFVNTIIYGAASTSIEMVAGILLALAFDRKFRFKQIAWMLMLLPPMTTPVIAGLLWRLLLNTTFGFYTFLLYFMGGPLLNPLGDPSLSLWATILVDTWKWTPFVFLITYAGLQSLPKSPIEAAMIDGASSYQMARRVILPMLTPVILVVLLLRLADAFNTYDIVFGLTFGGPGNSSSTISFMSYLEAWIGSELGLGSAYGIVGMAIIAAIITVFITKAGRHITGE